MLAPSDAKDANIFIDAGISAEAMMLGFAKRGIFGCMIRSFNKESVSELASADGYEPLMVIALGYPAEEVKVASVAEYGYKYFRDEEGCHVVPKLSADQLILK
jgi:nitroreductase